MFFIKLRLLVIVTGVAALSVGVAMYAVQTANASSGPQSETTAVPAAPVNSTGQDSRRDVDLNKALAEVLTDAANIGMPGIGEARVKALLARAKADEKMKALLKDQFDAALGEACGRWVEFMAGRGTLSFLLDSLERLLEAERDLSNQKADHVAALEQHLNRLREVEKVNNGRFQEGRVAIQDVLEPRFYRLQAEIRLERARRDLAK